MLGARALCLREYRSSFSFGYWDVRDSCGSMHPNQTVGRLFARVSSAVESLCAHPPSDILVCRLYILVCWPRPQFIIHRLLLWLCRPLRSSCRLLPPRPQTPGLKVGLTTKRNGSTRPCESATMRLWRFPSPMVEGMATSGDSLMTSCALCPTM